MNQPAPVHYSPQEREALINQWRTSGKTKREFCDNRGIKIQTFYSWFKPIKPKQNHGSFLPIKITASPIEIFAEISIVSGTRITLHQPVSADYLKSLL